MRNLITKAENFKRIEFWAATALFVFVVFFFITDGIDAEFHRFDAPNRYLFDEANVNFHYYSNYFIPKLIRYFIIFPAFLYANFVLVPGLLQKRDVGINVFMLVILFIVLGSVFGTTDTYIKAYMLAADKPIGNIYTHMFIKAFAEVARLAFIFAIYTALKRASIYLLSSSENLKARYPYVTNGGLTVFVIWLIILFLLLVGDADGPVIMGWMLVVPSGIAIYWLSFHNVIPRSLNKKKPFLWYLGVVLLILLAGSFPIAFVMAAFLRHGDVGIALASLNFFVQLLITAPLSWVLFKRHIKGNEEVYALRTELGQTNANLDFLRSQINPHFLFNALNTLYGAAIEEKAEKTSEGIERLGDMMRFMLQENMQDKIPLSREIDYLTNYISLQRLRTDSNPNVKIEERIERTVHLVQIAPMFLIPFVENAFKHGISFREPSNIKISLEFKENTLYFDVYNNKHERPQIDPEKNKSGIGLNNVKQRLQLLYPGKHELVIRETGKEFFVHLTIRLSK
jgi:two-component system, LytTR family, sensor kinase